MPNLWEISLEKTKNGDNHESSIIEDVLKTLPEMFTDPITPLRVRITALQVLVNARRSCVHDQLHELLKNRQYLVFTLPNWRPRTEEYSGEQAKLLEDLLTLAIFHSSYKEPIHKRAVANEQTPHQPAELIAYTKSNLERLRSSGRIDSFIFALDGFMEQEEVQRFVTNQMQRPSGSALRRRFIAYGAQIRRRQQIALQKEQENIQKMKDLREQGFSYWKIADIFNSMKVPTKTHKGKWQARTVQRILLK